MFTSCECSVITDQCACPQQVLLLKQSCDVSKNGPFSQYRTVRIESSFATTKSAKKKKVSKNANWMWKNQTTRYVQSLGACHRKEDEQSQAILGTQLTKRGCYNPSWI